MNTYKGMIDSLPENGIFVFGSNTQGRHGKGAALKAKNEFGAIYGQSWGRQGSSYAIVTKDLTKTQHPSIKTDKIIGQIELLYSYSKKNSELDFYVVYSGKGVNLNGYTPKHMADMFRLATRRIQMPENIIFEEEFAKLIENG